MNLELIKENLNLIEKIENKQLNFEIFAPRDLQVNYKNYHQTPEKMKKIILSFIKINENIQKKYNNDIKIPKVKEIIRKIKEDLKKLLENNNNIKNNIPKSLSQGNQNKNFNEFKNEYSKRNRDYIDKVSFYLKHFELLITKLNNLRETIKQKKKQFENISDYVKDLKDDDPKVEESLKNIYKYFRDISDGFKAINDVVAVVALFEKPKNNNNNDNDMNILNELNKKRENIFKENSNRKDEEIKNFFTKIITYINDLNSFYKTILDYIKDFQDYKIKESGMLFYGDIRLDILIILDTTNSMGEYLRMIQKNLLKIIEKIKDNCPLATVYLGFIGYKDFYDLELGDEYTDIDLTIDYNSVYDQIKDIQEDGGDDVPEDVAGAFKKGLEKSWGNGAKIAFLITDSPCHGTEYHDLDQNNKLMKDNYPKGYYEGEEDFEKIDIKHVVKEFAERDIFLVCFNILKFTDKMFKKFQDIYKDEKKSELFSIEKYKKNIDKIIIQKATDLMKEKEKKFEEYLSNEENIDI
jgi:hypothetical protein